MDRSDGPNFTRDDVKILSAKLVYDGFFRMKKFILKHRLIEGGWTGDISRECFLRPAAVGVLLYDPYQDKVVVIEQFRIGTLDSPEGPWQIELVAGMVEDGESKEQVAHREVREETGAEILELEYICEYYPSPGGSNEKMYLYCGGVDSEELGGASGLSEESEDIWVHVFGREELWAALKDNYIQNASTLIALQWLQMNWERLQQQWQ
jgi:ADP-ribose pyrophosphatase